jgi:hypothetical protein
MTTNLERLRELAISASDALSEGTPEEIIDAGRALNDACSGLIDEIERLENELRQCMKEKNDLVVKAYPAMDRLDDVLKAASNAYGALWRDLAQSALSNEARRMLRDVLTRDELAAGIGEALGRYGDPHEGEIWNAALLEGPDDTVKENERLRAVIRILEDEVREVRAANGQFGVGA